MTDIPRQSIHELLSSNADLQNKLLEYEARLAMDEQLANAVIEQTSEAIVVCDQNATIVRANTPAQQLCGTNPVGQQFDHCFPLVDEAKQKFNLKNIFLLGDHPDKELWLADSRPPLQLKVVATLLQQHENTRTPSYSIINLTDITRTKQAGNTGAVTQEQLDMARRARKVLLSIVEDVKASDERLQKIASQLPGMIYQFQRHPDGRQSIPFASDAIKDIFRLKASDVRRDASQLFDRIHPDDKQDTLESIRVSAENLSPWRREFRIMYEDGEVRWLYGDSVPQEMDDGSILWHGFVSDITEHKADEAKIALAANVFKQSREGIIITDALNNIIMVNHAFTHITGYGEAEALGKNPSLLASDRQDRDFYREMWNEIETRGYWEGEIWNRRKDGSIYPEWLSITRTFDKNDQATGYIGIFDDITERKEYEQHIQWLAHYDLLTGLPNRTLLRDRFQYAVSMAQRNHKRVALLFCDLDRFKNINDALGHSIGDLLLTEVARRLSAAVRKEDTVSRQGGDEFIILLSESGAESAAHVVEKIQAVINQPYDINGYEMTVSSSIGIAVFPDDGEEFDTLAKHADIAMYRAKHMGRNNYHFYTPELQKTTARALKLEKDIHNAIENNELVLYYQPQVALSDGGISGVEALLRWNHPDFGLISPQEFIPISENSGEILRIGAWVTRTATRQLKTWLDSGVKPIRLSVNLSVRELRQPQLFEKLKTILDETGLDPRYLELEITESMLMEDQENVIKTLHQINSLGIHLSIDDFGTGYSSLSYLKRLPVDELKIDKAFIQDMLTDPGDAIIARSIITLGHSLGLQVVAEGVEENAQLDFLRAHFCDHIQGYLFSKPVPAERITEMLARSERLSLLTSPHQFPGTPTLLIVDDEIDVLNSIKRTLHHDGYHILAAQSGQQGLELLSRNEVSVIISDQRMPGMTGIEFLNTVKTLYPDVIRIILSGYTHEKIITDAMNSGDIYKFLTKPLDAELLRNNVSEAFEHYNLSRENRRLARELRDANKALAERTREQDDPES